jgi:hypothetical protein
MAVATIPTGRKVTRMIPEMFQKTVPMISPAESFVQTIFRAFSVIKPCLSRVQWYAPGFTTSCYPFHKADFPLPHSSYFKYIVQFLLLLFSTDPLHIPLGQDIGLDMENVCHYQQHMVPNSGMTNAFLILPAMCIPFKHSEMGNTVGNH